MTEPTNVPATKPTKPKAKPAKTTRPRKTLPSPELGPAKLAAVLAEVEARILGHGAPDPYPPNSSILVDDVRRNLWRPLEGTGYHPEERALAELKANLSRATTAAELRALLAELEGAESAGTEPA